MWYFTHLKLYKVSGGITKNMMTFEFDLLKTVSVYCQQRIKRLPPSNSQADGQTDEDRHD